METNLKLLIDKPSFDILALFSREETFRIFNDIKASLQHSAFYEKLTFQEIMALQAHLQANFTGYELFCIAQLK